MGEMTVNMTNGVDIPQLRLTEVIYSPKVGYTLVSVSHLDEKGFSVTFANSKCMIQGQRGNALVKSQRWVVACIKLHMSLKWLMLQGKSLPWTSSIVEWDIFLLKWHESLLTRVL
jgi:hypothetical protein